jgi:probable HAF family extracellular repeat protein
MITSLASFLRRRFAPAVLRHSSIRPSANSRRTRRLSLESLEPLCMLSGYTITDLGTLGGDYSEAFGINNRGQVVGTSDTGVEDPVNGLLSDAFLWSSGNLTDLGTLGGQFSGANGLNDRGQIVGYAQNDDPDPASGAVHAALWDQGTLRDLGTLPGKLFSDAWDINNRGQVTGRSFDNNPDANPVTSPPDVRAFVWQKDVMTELPLPVGFKNPFTGAINDRGQIAGFAADNATVHPLV